MKPTFWLALGIAGLAAGCATPKAPYNYEAFRQSRPASMLVLPPLNDSKDVKATAGVLSTATLPLAEAGYYVMPVSLVDETFRQNGLTTAADIHDVSPAKLREIFGADAAVYMRVKQYGTTYMVIGSETRVTVEGRIVDLRSGRLLWEGQATSSSQESDTSNQAGLAGLLIKALVTQIVGTVADASYNYASITNTRLLGAPRKDGVLAGPRSPNYQKD
jgi:hypothetical protein